MPTTIDTTILTAADARAIANEVQDNSFDKAMQAIKVAAEQGFEEQLLFGIWLSRESVFKLMGMGYAVTTVLHPFEQRNMYKVNW